MRGGGRECIVAHAANIDNPQHDGPNHLGLWSKVPRPFGASMAELRAALRAFYGADDPPSEPSPPPPPPPAAGSGSFQISAAEYLEILVSADQRAWCEGFCG